MSIAFDNLDFEKADGLITAVIQDSKSGTVLMVGYQNREAFNRSLECRKVVFWSRTKNRLWLKGETSGNFLSIVDILTDCDGDALVYLVEAPGATCHKGDFSCFQERQNFDFLSALSSLIEKRKEQRPENSYTTALFESGIDRIAQKLGEEAVELVIAAKNANQENFRNESADLLYHFLVLCAEKNISFNAVIDTLRARHEQNRPGGEG